MTARRTYGFTIVEIIVVVIVLGILVSFVSLFFMGIQKQARDDKRVNDMRVIAAGLQKYYDANGQYPLSCNFSGAQTCAALSTSYQTATGSAPLSTLGAATTSANLLALLPTVNATFGDPLRGSNNPINVLNTTNTSYVSKKSYFYLSTDLYNLATSANLATNDSASTNITCNFSAHAYTKSGVSRSGSSHYYILGYFSETQNKWIFYSGPFLDTLNDLRWNNDSKAECTPQSL